MSIPARTRLEMHGARRSQISSPGQRARPQTIVSSKLAFTNIDNKHGAVDNAISYEVVVRDAFTAPYLRISPQRGGPLRGARSLLGGRRGPAISEFGDSPPWPLGAAGGETPCTSLSLRVGGSLCGQLSLLLFAFSVSVPWTPLSPSAVCWFLSLRTLVDDQLRVLSFLRGDKPLS